MNRIVAALVKDAVEEERQEAAKKLEEALNVERQEVAKKLEEIANKMFNKGLSIKDIADFIGISNEEVQKLVKNCI